MVTVEASSLSSLIDLASNPPLDPFRPLSAQYQDLTLYIAKVPGSRDVILTPLKPRAKVVTVEDIQASLYYLHVQCPEDGSLLDDSILKGDQTYAPPIDPGHALTAGPSPPLKPQTQRRPLPPLPPEAAAQSNTNAYESRNPPYPLNDGYTFNVRIPAVPQPIMEPRKPVNTVVRKPIQTPALFLRHNVANQHNIEMGQPVSHPAQEPFSLRAPGPPRSENRRPSPDYPGKMVASRENAPVHELDAGMDGRPRGLTSGTQGPSAHTLYAELDSHPRRTSPQSSEQPSPTSTPSFRLPSPIRTITQSSLQQDGDLCITVIRRDPASGQQWNVASIRDPPIYDVNSSQGQKSRAESLRKKGQPLYIDLTTTGYSRFLHQQSNRQRPPADSAPQALLEDTFQRRLWMEGSIFEQQAKHRKSLSAESGPSPSLTPALPPRPTRYSSELPPSRNDYLNPHPSPTLHSLSLDPAAQRSKTRGYTFLSPWNTRCEFAAGVGHSLKCRHSMPPGPQWQGRGAVDPVQISELRFNLPGGGPLASSSPTREKQEHGFAKRSRFLHRRKLSAEDVYPNGDGSMRMDLSLGQERAGGGFAGKQAKLGKLIVSAEGMKMLDLLVAANMGLWWRAYGKGSG